MWIVSAVFFFCLGLLAGYQLPVWLAAWRAWRRRRGFRLTVLRQYKPAAEQQAAPQEQSNT